MRGGKDQVRRRSLLSDYATDLGQLVSRKRSQDALHAAGIESALANRTKTEFLANMSHELRTPLNAIIGFSGLLKEMNAQELGQQKTQDYIDHIANAGKHLLRIINDILTISKIESGNFTLEVHAHAMGAIVDACVAMVYPRMKEKTQLLNVSVAPGLSPVAVDDARIKQVLLNLLSNASKFTPDGGRISVAVTADNPAFVTCTVTDNGRGMSEEELAYAQKPFAQVQSSYSRDQEGTGLGLPIAKQLVLQHGGQFRISSRPDAGTTAVFTLPVAESGAEADGLPPVLSYARN